MNRITARLALVLLGLVFALNALMMPEDVTSTGIIKHNTFPIILCVIFLFLAAVTHLQIANNKKLREFLQVQLHIISFAIAYFWLGFWVATITLIITNISIQYYEKCMPLTDLFTEMIVKCLIAFSLAAVLVFIFELPI